MARKGTLPPKAKLKPYRDDGRSPRCQGIKWPKDGKRYGEQCKNSAIKGRPFCKFHGGKAGRPIKHGNRSKYSPVPKGLEKMFLAARIDPDLLNLTDHIAMLDAQMWSIGEKAKNQTSFNPAQTKELLKIMKERREMTKGEIERRTAIGSLMPIEDVMQIIQYLYSVVNKHVPDQTTKQKIGAEFRDIIRPRAAAIEAKKAAVGGT